MIWLMGYGGLLGAELASHLESHELPWIGTDREVDVTDPEALRSFAARREIRWIINCAGYTAVDKAEDEPELCRRINRDGPANIGGLATKISANVVHISTDYVFDGSVKKPYREDDPVSPLNVYGRTKAEGEVALQSACHCFYILRTAWLYGRFGPNFVHTMIRLMNEKDRIGVVADQWGTPTSSHNLARAITAVIRADSEKFGIYHFTDEGETTWFNFALEIQRLARKRGLLKRDCTIQPLRSSEYPAKANRPVYSVLCKDKIRSAFGIPIEDWRSSLKTYINSENVLDVL